MLRLYKYIYVVKLGLLLFILILSKKAYNQNDSINYWDISLNKLIQTDVVSVLKTQNPISDIPANIYIVSSKDILERGYLSIEDVLADVPGFQFRNIQGFNSYVFLRGLPNQNNYIILMQNGIPINEINSGGFYGGSYFNLDNIKQIEIVYGPASSLYGTNSLSGVINIVTESPIKNNEFEVNSHYGTNNSFEYNANYRRYNTKNKIGYSFSGMYNTTDKQNLKNEIGDYNWSDKFENFENNYALESKYIFKNIEFGINIQNKQASRTSQFKSIETKYQDYGTNWDILFANAYLKYYKDINEKLKINTKVYYINTTVLNTTISYIIKPDSISTGKQVRQYRPNYLYGAEILFKYNPFDWYKILLATSFEIENVSNGFGISNSNSNVEIPSVPNRPEILQNSISSLLLQNNISLFSNFKFIAGARLDYSTLYREVFTPRAGIVYYKNKIITKLLFLQAFRAPKNWDYKYGSGNPDLLPEEITSHELIVNYKPNKYFNLNFTAFNNNLRNGIIKNIVADRWENIQKINIIGSELSLNFNIKNFNIFSNYSYNLPRDINKNLIPEISKHIINTGLTYRFKSFIIDLRGHYYSNKINPSFIVSTNNNLIDDALVFNSSISFFKLKGLNLKFSINNIFDTEYYHTSNTTVSRYRQLGRMFIFHIKYNVKGI